MNVSMASGKRNPGPMDQKYVTISVGHWKRIQAQEDQNYVDCSNLYTYQETWELIETANSARDKGVTVQE